MRQFLNELRQKGVSDFGDHFSNNPGDVDKCLAMVNVVNVNKATLNLYGAKSIDEIVGGLSGVLTEESNRKQFSGELVALAQGKTYYEAEMDNRTLQGETKHCDVICCVIPGYEQSLAKVLICIVDLTPQKRLEAELRGSEERYRELFEASPVSLWEDDLTEVKQFLDELRQRGVSDFDDHFANHPKDLAKCSTLIRVVNVNKATLDLYGAKSADEIIGGERVSRIFTPGSNQEFLGDIVSLAKGKQYFEAEVEIRTLLGETKHCNLISAVVPGYEQSLGKVLFCLVDLTPQKRLEAQLVKSQRFAAIGETAGMVGHDLRNPLQGIAGAAYNIRRHFRDSIDPSTNEMLEVIDNGVQYANGIVNDLLEFSREMQLQLLPATPKSIVAQTFKGIKVPQNVMIEDTTTDTPEILVDVPKIERVLANLIQNAIDAMPEGGKLSISSINHKKRYRYPFATQGLESPRTWSRRFGHHYTRRRRRELGWGCQSADALQKPMAALFPFRAQSERGRHSR